MHRPEEATRLQAQLRAELDLRRNAKRGMGAVLPVAAVEAELLCALEATQVVIVHGGTGSGKTTQVRDRATLVLKTHQSLARSSTWCVCVLTAHRYPR